VALTFLWTGRWIRAGRLSSVLLLSGRHPSVLRLSEKSSDLSKAAFWQIFFAPRLLRPSWRPSAFHHRQLSSPLAARLGLESAWFGWPKALSRHRIQSCVLLRRAVSSPFQNQ